MHGLLDEGGPCQDAAPGAMPTQTDASVPRNLLLIFRRLEKMMRMETAPQPFISSPQAAGAAFGLLSTSASSGPQPSHSSDVPTAPSSALSDRSETPLVPRRSTVAASSVASREDASGPLLAQQSDVVNVLKSWHVDVHSTCGCSSLKLGSGPSVSASVTGVSPIWRCQPVNTQSHLILTWNLPSHFVEVRGTFSTPPWQVGISLWWCPRRRCHWVDLHESHKQLGGVLQFKFVVDGQWRCDPSYPICDDGTAAHCFNNVCLIFPPRLRLRLSHQKLRRRQSAITANRNWGAVLEKAHPMPANPLLNDGTCSARTSRWVTSEDKFFVCKQDSHQGKNDTQETLHGKRRDDGSSTTAVAVNGVGSTSGRLRFGRLLARETANQEKCQPRRVTRIPGLRTNPTWAGLRVESAENPQSLLCASSAHDQLTPRSPTINGTGAITSVACRRWLITQSLAYDSKSAPDANSTTTPSLVTLPLSHVSSSAPIVAEKGERSLKCETCKVPAERNERSRQEVTVRGVGCSKNEYVSPSPPGAAHDDNHHNSSKAVPEGEHSNFSGGEASTIDTPPHVGPPRSKNGDDPRASILGGDAAITVASRASCMARRREKQKHLDSLVRSLSHHGGRRPQAGRWESNGRRARVSHWPDYVTSWLHDPNVLLELYVLPKVLKVRNEHLCLRTGWSMASHPEKRSTGGADSFYISSDGRVMVIADGVSAWDQLGVNSRAYADELVSAVRDVWEDPNHFIHELARKRSLKPSLFARELMTLAASQPVSYGSATCCVCVFDANKEELGVCNLGDSGACLLRRNNKGQMTPYFKTPEMSHFFNCPYQLSKTPSHRVIEKILGLKNVNNGKGFVLPAQDAPKHGQCFDVAVEEGDLLLVATDGLWDNLWTSEIASLSSLTLTPLEALILHDESLVTEATDLARALTEAAGWKSQNPKSTTPFAKNYTAECGRPGFTGGKWDDITVLAAWVARSSNLPHSASKLHSISCQNVCNDSTMAEIYGVDGELLVRKPAARKTFKAMNTYNATTSWIAEGDTYFCTQLEGTWRWPYISHSDGDLSD